MSTLAELLVAHDVACNGDNAFQRRARLLQSMWREARALPKGVNPRSGAPLGSSIPERLGEQTLANFLTENVRGAVRRALTDTRDGQNIEERRMFANLLSSQPLCFNLFGELAADLDLATRVARRLFPTRVHTVTKVCFEYSPGRSSPRYSDDKTSFDVCFEHTASRGGRGFIGVEVKYHEDLRVRPAEHRARYDAITRAMGCFREESLAQLRRKPCEQIWRDHMLAGSMLLAGDGWETGLYVFLYPEANAACRQGLDAYRACLASTDTIDGVTLEQVVSAIEAETDASWIGELRDRYLNWSKIDRAIQQ